MDGVFVLLVIVLGGAFIGFIVLRAIWNALSTDWFGLYYEDKDSAYYHDKLGKGRGHR